MPLLIHFAPQTTNEKTCVSHCGPRCYPEEQKGITGMTTAATLLTLIVHAQQHVAALESLAAGMVAGLRAGMVDADHLYTLMTTQTRAIHAQLDEVVATMEKVELQTARNDSDGPPLYRPQCLASSEKGNFGNHTGKISHFFRSINDLGEIGKR